MNDTERLFGTDGIRGEANVHPMTAEVALRCGQALGSLLRDGRLGRPPVTHGTLLPTQQAHRPRVVMGKDTRASGYMFEQALCAGLASMGVDVMLTGPLPTPAVAFITSSMRADAGIVISASHNPYQDNGIKIFGHDGFKLPDELERELERLIRTGVDPSALARGEGVGRATRIDDAKGRYIVHLKGAFPDSLSLEGLRVVVDSAHGAAYAVTATALRELGASVVEIGAMPDGININDGVGSLHPQMLQRAVVEHRAHLGIALDGDADRVIVVDERGQVVDGDALMAVCAVEMAQRKALRGSAIVATVMSNTGLERCLRAHGISVERVAVGDRHVVERMRARGLALGGEQSGHIVFLDHTTTGDGSVAGLHVLGAMLRAGKPLSELVSFFVRTPQEQVNVRIAQRKPLEQLPGVQQAIADVERALGADGRVLVRFSGTEPKVRVLVEGPDAEAIKVGAAQIANALGTALGTTLGTHDVNH
jgi:phosphoglucosamine mutase